MDAKQEVVIDMEEGLVTAAEMGDVTAVTSFIEQGAQQGDYALAMAIKEYVSVQEENLREKYADVIQYLLNAALEDYSQSYATALLLEEKELSNLLKSLPTNDYRTIFIVLAESNVDTIRPFEERWADLEMEDKIEAIATARYAGRDEVVEYLESLDESSEDEGVMMESVQI